MFDHDHRVSTRGQGAAGSDAHALSGRQVPAHYFIDVRAAHEFDVGGIALTRAKGVGGPHGEAVHARPVHGRQIFGGANIGGRYSVQTLFKGKPFRCNRRESGQKLAEPGRADDPEKTVIHA